MGDLEVTHVWQQLHGTIDPQHFSDQEKADYLKSIAARPMDEYTGFIWDSFLAEVKT